MENESPEVNLLVEQRDFKYYIFDWDDNILHMPTRIHLEKRQPDGTWAPHDVSTAVFSVVRQDKENYRPLHNSWSDAYEAFQDDLDGVSDPAGRFLSDTATAIQRVLDGAVLPGPSYNTFRKTLVEGRLFAIVTARGHASETIRRGVEMFIERALTDDDHRQMMVNLRGYRQCFDGVTEFGTDAEELAYYLDLNRYRAVTSPEFMDYMDREVPGKKTPEARKQFAIRDFVEHIFRVLEHTPQGAGWKPISVGFSDDDPANVAKVQEYIEQALAARFPGVKFVVYDTSDPALEKGRKLTVAGQLDLGLND